MTAAHLLLLLGPLAPLLLLLPLALPASGRALVPRLLWLAPLPALLAALLAAEAPPLVLDATRLRFTLGLDAPAALLLGVVAALWSAAGLYAAAYLGTAPRFAAWWLVTLSGSLGVFLAGDLISFYLAFALASLPAYGLIVHAGTGAARRAGAVTLLLAVLGEVFLLLAFALLADRMPGPSLAIADVVAGLGRAPSSGLISGLLVLGFGIKAGLVPLHVWLPLAHPAAPMPASAVLSGAIVKAGIIGLLRFLPMDGLLAETGTVLAALGMLTAFWGVACGVTQANPKSVLAYSTVSQMGVVMAVIGAGMRLADAGTPAAAAFYAAHHVLAKGALFLAVGVAATGGLRGRGFWLVLVPAVILAVGFGGLPPTGGALAKAAVKDQLGGALLGPLAWLSAAGSTALMLHFAARLAATAAPRPAPVRAALLGPWLGLAGAAVLLPWLLWPGPDPLAALAAKDLLPVLAGGLGFLALQRWGARLPTPPEGDVLALWGRAGGLAAGLGAGVARAEAGLSRWPAAGLCLLLLVAGMAALLWAGRP
jgi:formate hydrogenlyase subunit 3/multisubunit Na+/H+ antiporter MnhD subunit